MNFKIILPDEFATEDRMSKFQLIFLFRIMNEVLRKFMVATETTRL